MVDFRKAMKTYRMTMDLPHHHMLIILNAVRTYQELERNQLSRLEVVKTVEEAVMNAQEVNLEEPNRTKS